jgi:dihydrofolate synthase / folylpolyglutamate synthase
VGRQSTNSASGAPSESRAAQSDDLLRELKNLHPLMIDLSLGRIEALLAKLGSPHKKLPPVVHIAGTNGKGSTTAFLRAMFEAAGKRVHAYTSPHLVRFHERISVPGGDGVSRPISENLLVDALERVKRANAGEQITFFEITNAAAFLVFAEIPADVVLLEVGLGGRLDSTNVIERPQLTIITPVAMDHAAILGATLPLIAAEKAGILKPDVQSVISMQAPDALDVICAIARRVRAPLFTWGEDFEAFDQRGRLVYQSEDEMLDLPLPALIGRHQVVNAGTAVAAAQLLKPIGMTDSAIERGLQTVSWPARMQRLTTGPLVAALPSTCELWLDGGHNPAGAQAVAQTVADLEERAPKPLYLVVGMMGQKDAPGFFDPFRGLATHVITVPIPGAHEATHTPDVLAKIATERGLLASVSKDVPSALATLRPLLKGPARVLICGSLYLAGHVLALQEGVTAQSN